MSFLDDLFSFEGFHGKEILSDIWHDPSRLLTGVDPFSTNMWNGILGTDNEPLVDQWGGATDQRYIDAEAKGIDTGAGRMGQDVAHMVASSYAGDWAGGTEVGEYVQKADQGMSMFNSASSPTSQSAPPGRQDMRSSSYLGLLQRLNSITENNIDPYAQIELPSGEIF